MSLNQPPGKRKLFSKAKPKPKEDPDQKKRALQQKKKQLKKEQKKLEQELKALEPKEEKPQEHSFILPLTASTLPLASLLPEANLIYNSSKGKFEVVDLPPGKVELTHQFTSPVEHINLSVNLASQSKNKKPLWQVARVSEKHDESPGYLSKSEHVYEVSFDSFEQQIDLKKLAQQIKESPIESNVSDLKVDRHSGRQVITLSFMPALYSQESALLDAIIQNHNPATYSPPIHLASELNPLWDQNLIKAQQEMKVEEKEQKQASQELKVNKNLDVFPKKLFMKRSDKKENT
jgi:hypothetical protein